MKNMKEKMINILFIIILVIGSYELVKGVKQIIMIEVKTKIVLNERDKKSFDESIKKIKENTKKINNLQKGYYTKEELKDLKDSFNEILEKKEKLYKFLTSNESYNSYELFNAIDNSLGFDYVREQKILKVLLNHEIINEQTYELLRTKAIDKEMLNSSKLYYKTKEADDFILKAEVISWKSEFDYYAKLSDLVLESEVIINEK